MSIIINNFVPGLPAGMVLLKAIVYEKPVIVNEKEFKRYLTLFTFVPQKDYKKKVETMTFKDGSIRPINTNGVFVKIIGSMEGLFPVNNRINLANYQKLIVSVGWNFKTSVTGVEGMDYEVARKLAFGVIHNLKKEKVNKSKNLSPEISFEWKNKMMEYVNNIRTLSSLGEDYTGVLHALEDTIDKVEGINLDSITKVLDSIDQIVFENQCGLAHGTCCECEDANCIYMKIEDRVKYIKEALHII